MKIRKSDIFRILLTPALEILAFLLAFWSAYFLRTITDWIPFIQLRIPYISVEQFSPFVLYGVILWIGIFVYARLYSHIRRPLFAEISTVIKYSFFWFLIYIGFVYLATGFLFSKEIPRLIIFYTLLLWTVFSVIIRSILHAVWQKLYSKKIIEKQKILVINRLGNEKFLNQNDVGVEYVEHNISDIGKITQLMRNREVDAILLTSGEYSEKFFEPIISLAKTYGIVCSYPQIMPHMKHFSREESFIGGMPVVMLRAVSITPWGHIMKRICDIIFSLFFIILTLPVMILVFIGIKMEDRSGPAIYKNRRIGQNGKIFTLYKFRYMYWRFCTKEEYLLDGERDEGLEFEENLKKTNDSRNGPLYKIQNDPRKMKFWALIEKLSLDELPQLFNVLLGNMSIVGPRPHQPREVALYDESDKQVLTIKPGITGMAQVYGRDKNTFKEEVALDTYYIENYSFFLDIMIILRTILVVIRRFFEKK